MVVTTIACLPCVGNWPSTLPTCPGAASEQDRGCEGPACAAKQHPRESSGYTAQPKAPCLYATPPRSSRSHMRENRIPVHNLYSDMGNEQKVRAKRRWPLNGEEIQENQPSRDYLEVLRRKDSRAKIKINCAAKTQLMQLECALFQGEMGNESFHCSPPN